jgi:hypothetical protein
LPQIVRPSPDFFRSEIGGGQRAGEFRTGATQRSRRRQSRDGDGVIENHESSMLPPSPRDPFRLA